MPGPNGMPIPEDYGFVPNGSGSYQLSPRISAQTGGQSQTGSASSLLPSVLWGGGSSSGAAAPAAAANAGEYTLGNSLTYGGNELFPGGVGASGQGGFLNTIMSNLGGGTLQGGGQGILDAANAGEGIGAYALPAAAVAYGLYQANDLIKEARGKGFSQGVKDSLEPRYMLGTGLIGAPIIGGLSGLFGHRSTKEVQRERQDKLAAKDPNYSQALQVLRAGEKDSPNYGGRVSSNAAADFVGLDSNGQWTNNKFANSKDVNDLVGKDIWLTPDFFKQFPDWAQKSEAEKERIAQKVLAEKRASSSKGGINVNFEGFDPGGTPALKPLPSSYSQGANIDPYFNNPGAVGQTDPAKITQMLSKPGPRGRLSPGVYLNSKTRKPFLSTTGR